MSFNIPTSVNAYLAMKAILIAARAHPEIHSIAIPGLCKGIGRMPAPTGARQMYKAFEEIELGNKPNYEDYGDLGWTKFAFFHKYKLKDFLSTFKLYHFWGSLPLTEPARKLLTRMINKQ